jgi:peptide/nickel transport system permease protein
MSVGRSWLKGWGISGRLAWFWITLVLVAAVGDRRLPVDPVRQHLGNPLAAPSWSHWFGTNTRGIDVFALVVAGARTSMIVGIGAVAIGLSGGAAIGLIAGYFRGWIDRSMLVVLDAAAAFPALAAAVAAVLFWGKSVRNVTLVLGVLSIPLFARVMRANTLQYVDRDFIRASRMVGATHRRVLTRELLPNVAVPVLSYSLVGVGLVIAAEGGLSFFGAGVPDSVITWGQVIASGRNQAERAPQVVLLPSLVIFLTILALNKVSELIIARWAAGGLVLPKRSANPPPAAMPKPLPAGGALIADPQVLVQVADLHVWLHTPFGVVRAVNGVDLELRRGEMFALVGESGSGKTMLARSLLGLVPSPPLVPDLPGRVLFDGVDLLSWGAETLRNIRGRRIAMVFQDPMTQLDPVMRVGAQIAEPAMVHLGLTRKQAMARAVELLAEVGIADPQRRARAFTHELSGGLRQRVAIAIALAAEPEVLIADEPTSALDVTVQAQLLDLLQRLGRERGLSVLFITHDLGVVASRADEVGVMYGGRIVERGSTVDVFANPQHPYTRALLGAMPRLDRPAHQRLETIVGSPPILLFDQPGCAFAARCPIAEGRCLEQRPALAGAGHQCACWMAGVPAMSVAGTTNRPSASGNRHPD